MKEIISEGNGEQTPNDGASVEINLIGKHDGKVFDERDAKFVIGEGKCLSSRDDFFGCSSSRGFSLIFRGGKNLNVPRLKKCSSFEIG